MNSTPIQEGNRVRTTEEVTVHGITVSAGITGRVAYVWAGGLGCEVELDSGGVVTMKTRDLTVLHGGPFPRGGYKPKELVAFTAPANKGKTKL